MTPEEDRRTSSGSALRYQHDRRGPRPETERARYSAQSGRSDSPPPRKRTRSPSYEGHPQCDRDRWAPATTNCPHEPLARRERSASLSRRDRLSTKVSDSRLSLPTRPIPLPSRPVSGKSPSSTKSPEIKVSSNPDADPEQKRLHRDGRVRPSLARASPSRPHGRLVRYPQTASPTRRIASRAVAPRAKPPAHVR